MGVACTRAEHNRWRRRCACRAGISLIRSLKPDEGDHWRTFNKVQNLTFVSFHSDIMCIIGEGVRSGFPRLIHEIVTESNLRRPQISQAACTSSRGAPTSSTGSTLFKPATIGALTSESFR